MVDDNVDAAQSLANLLTLSGHETLIAHGGPRAVEAALTWRPDVALLGIGLPRPTGFEFARQILQQSKLTILFWWL